MKPDFFLVLPWHFKAGIVEREREFLEKRRQDDLSVSRDRDRLVQLEAAGSRRWKSRHAQGKSHALTTREKIGVAMQHAQAARAKGPKSSSTRG